MNKKPRSTIRRLAASALLAAIGTSAFHADAQSLNAVLDTRPLTPQEKKDYSLTTLQVSGGLTTVGIGQPFYLDALINSDIAPSNITSVTWTLLTKPLGSGAVITNSPLGANVPTYRLPDRDVLQVAGRAMLKPDLAGQYSVEVMIQTDNGSGSTNITKLLTAGTYLGAQTCALCHSGGAFASDIYTPWIDTPHAHAFEQAINGISTDHFNQNCIACHVVGFDTAPSALNGGFDDIAAQTGWTFPASISATNWDAMPHALQGVANIQCENCHGPGSEHAAALGNTNALNWPRLTVSMNVGDCAQCHDSLTHHYKVAEYNNSGHAVSPEELSSSCARCHTGEGFSQFVEGKTVTSVAEYSPIGCQTCHDPHDATHPHQTRPAPDIALMDGITVVTNGGVGKLCMNCHIGRRDAVTYVETSTPNSRFGPHHGPQTDMLVGANAITYGQDIPSAAHREVVEDSCVTCHMQDRENGDPGFTHVGGHTWKLEWDNDTPNDPSDDVHLTESCTECHGHIETFDLKRQDYDGNGILEGVQSEVKGLMSRLAMLLPPYGAPTVTPTSAYTMPERKALFNYMFVLEDGSYGIHNAPFAVGLLRASIADLTGDANMDGLPDAWQIQYFGSTTNINAAPNAMPAGDGVPNWLKYSLGLNPTVPGITLGDGVIWANTGEVGGANQPVRIYTAAEIVFDTEIGTSYQIQAISTLGGGWSDVGDPVAGTGSPMSFMTSTRNNVQQFFRVVPNM